VERIQTRELLGRRTVRLVALQERRRSGRDLDGRGRGRDLEDGRERRELLTLVEGRARTDSGNEFGRQ